MTTYMAFLTALGALSITGITRSFALGETPPASLNAADLPAKWLQLPEAEHAPLDFGPGMVWPRFSAELWIAVLPDAHSTPGKVFQSTIALMDAVAMAFNAEAGQSLAASATRYVMRQTGITVNMTNYWGIVVAVSAEG